jgi:pimeloyl-ACP methyl ester carboxylesterase
MNKKRKTIIAANEISELKTYSLGGYEQKVLIEGKRKKNPVVVFLHGGPGCPIPFCAGCRGMFPELTERFTMVYWDQLGCGINNYTIDESFSINNYIDMTVDLIRELKREFPENSINLFGVSWGTILAAEATVRVPELVHRVLVYGQVVKQLSFNTEVFEVLEKSNMSKKKKQKLNIIKRSDLHGLKDLKAIMSWVRKYTEGYQSKSGGKTPLGKIIFGLISSPDYSLKDFKAIIFNGCIKNKSLLTELMDVDLLETLKKIQIPYLILQGDTDIVTSTKFISYYVKTTGNSSLSYHYVKNSGHMPSAAGMNYIMSEGLDFLAE